MARESTTGKHKRKYRWLIAVMILAAAGAGFLWHRSQQVNSVQNLQTVAITRGDIENTITAVGILQPSRYVDVGAQVSGQLKLLKVEVGDDVESGQLLAEIDPRIYVARVDEAKATLENLRAQLKIKKAQLVLWSKQHARHEDLLRQDALAESEVEVSEASLATARAEIEAIGAQIRQAEAALENATVNLGYTKITAPMAGTVVSISASEGQTLNANQQTPIILRIADMDVMTVWTQVSEADVLRLKNGQEAYFTVLGQPHRSWHGQLRQVLPTPEIVNNVTFYNALFDVPNPEHELKVQMTAQVFFVLEKARQALLVPVSALGPVGSQGGARGANGAAGEQQRTVGEGTDGGKISSVQVLKPDGTLEEKTVRVGVMSHVYAEIISGLQEGEKVITGAGAQPAKKANGGGLGAGKTRGRL